MNGSLLVAFDLLKFQGMAGHDFNRRTFPPIEYGQLAPCVSVLFLGDSRFVSGEFAFAICPRSLIRPALSGVLFLRICSSIRTLIRNFEMSPRWGNERLQAL
ncbi:hypothetical protein [Enterobacter hormaechei]|uniref:hypothetical protein n=1 Tax=Enterobacter hormaechei TaxID=158836 RepID=UPI0030A4F8CB